MKHRNVLLLVILLALALWRAKEIRQFCRRYISRLSPYEYVDEAGNLAGLTSN